MNTPDNFPESSETNTQKIRELNDLFRSIVLGGKVMFTSGVAALGTETMREVIFKIQEYNDFTEDNDPYGEHDFGSVTLEDNTKILWKIDYYDHSMEYASENPANPEQTTRVLTIMLASEY